MKTTNNKMQRVNEMFTDSYSVDQMIDTFIYLTNKSRGKHCTEKAIVTAYNNREFAQLLRRLDPISYQLIGL